MNSAVPAEREGKITFNRTTPSRNFEYEHGIANLSYDWILLHPIEAQSLLVSQSVCTHDVHPGGRRGLGDNGGPLVRGRADTRNTIKPRIIKL
jgi:hypothetical protein